MENNLDISKNFSSGTSFDNLMEIRIRNILLICSNYDAFILEEDGRINEQIFNEYVSLNLRHPPVFFQVSTEEEANKIIETEKIDLIITMLNLSEESPTEIAKNIKTKNPDIPLVVLSPFLREISKNIDDEKHKYIDYIFSWLGNSNILVAIIKLIEDNMNAEHDINGIGVQAILLVEDSVRYYSSYLPNMYRLIFLQSKSFMIEGLNEQQQMLRQRGRPKILLATTFEQALELYTKYKDNILGIISDMSFKNKGVNRKSMGSNYIYAKIKDTL